MSTREPSEENVRAMLAETGRYEYRARRDLVSNAVKSLRLRRHAIVHTNEFFGAFIGLVQGLATLWSPERAGREEPESRASIEERDV